MLYRNWWPNGKVQEITRGFSLFDHLTASLPLFDDELNHGYLECILVYKSIVH